MMAIFAQVLERAITQEDMDSTFVEMGGDSLCYIDLVERLGQAFVPQHHEEFTLRCMERFDDFSIERAKDILRSFDVDRAAGILL